MALTFGGNNASTTYTGIISGLGNMTKTGSGTFSLGSTSTYAGSTTISAGTVKLASTVAPPAGATAIYNFNFSDAQDSTATANNGAVVGGATYVPGTKGLGVNLNGSQYVTVPYNAAALGLNAYTVSIWVNPNSGTQNANATLISTRNGGETTFDLQLVSAGGRDHGAARGYWNWGCMD